MLWFRHWKKRRKRKLILAPPEKIIRSLAVFRRAFLIIRAQGGTQDRAGQLFGGWLANTLPNVPASLCYHETTGWVDSRPTVFPRYVRRYAPEPIASNCAWIFSAGDDPAELGLQADLSNLDLAPPEKLRQYLSIFYYACLTMRLMQNYGTGRAFWKDVETKWSANADQYGAYCAVLADVLHDVPTGLVHWSQFDEREFWRQAQAHPRDDQALQEQIQQIKHKHPRFGTPRVHALLRADGQVVNHKRVERLWQKSGLQVPQRPKKRKIKTGRSVPCQAERPNHVWSYDFQEDSLLSGRKIRLLNVLDEFTREWLSVTVGGPSPAKPCLPP